MTNKNARVWTGSEWANLSGLVAAPNAVLAYQSASPTSPTTGQIWMDSDDKNSYIWTGSAWAAFSSVFHYQSTSPANPVNGEVWIDSDNDQMYIWNGTAWINVTSRFSYQSASPTATAPGEVWMDSDTDSIYIWNGTSWVPFNNDLSSYLPTASISASYAPINSPTFTGTVTLPSVDLTNILTQRANIVPASTGTVDVGTSLYRVRNVYAEKIHSPGAVIQVVSKTFDDVTTNSTTNQGYFNAINGDLNITSKYLNSKFLISVQGQGYISSGSGTNLGISRTISASTTRLLGTDGTGGDSWMGSGNGAGTNSWNIKRDYLDSPNQAAGTLITYRMLLGRWTSGTVYLNYSGYVGGSTITIMEIAA